MGDEVEEASEFLSGHSSSAAVQLTIGQATMGVYPFMFGTAKDFEPIVAEMDKVCSLRYILPATRAKEGNSWA